MQEEYETEIVENIGERTLDKARNALKKDVRMRRISKICSITIPILIGIILIGFPILMHNINVEKNDRYWKEMIGSADINYNELIKEESETIEELNDKTKGKFYWIDNAIVTETYVLKQEDKIIVIEEHYLYEGIECILYIKNENSKILNMDIDSMLDKNFLFDNYNSLNYGIFDGLSLGNFKLEYVYQIKIASTDTSTIETIFSNLTND